MNIASGDSGVHMTTYGLCEDKHMKETAAVLMSISQTVYFQAWSDA